MITLSHYYLKNTSPPTIKLTQTPYCYNNMWTQVCNQNWSEMPSKIGVAT